MTPNEVSLITDSLRGIREDQREIRRISVANSSEISSLKAIQENHNTAVVALLEKQKARVDAVCDRLDQHEDDPVPQVSRFLNKKVLGGSTGLGGGGIIIAIVAKILGWY